MSGLARNKGMVGPEVTPPSDAGPAVRLIAFYGRDPNWSPPDPSGR